MFLEEIGNLPGYELIDTGQGARLERFGDFILDRPDPAVLWQRALPESEWQKAVARYVKSGEERGKWQQLKRSGVLPEKWLMHFKPEAGDGDKTGGAAAQPEISFFAQLTPFKHTGIFPEQAANWNFIARILADHKAAGPAKPQIKFLNLFGYTGIASILAAKLGAEVTHVDASKPSITWAKENMLASGLREDAIRWILDDSLKFVKREAKRGKTYDAVLLDPPAFGRGAKGEVWKFNEDLPKLLKELQNIVAADFKFLIINAYAVSVSALLLKNLLEDFQPQGKIAPARKIDYGELILKEKSARARQLSTGIFARLY